MAMDERDIEQLLREYAAARGDERLFSEPTALALRARLKEAATEDGAMAGRALEEAVVPGTTTRPSAAARRRYRPMIIAATAAVAALALFTVPAQYTHEYAYVGLDADGAYDKLDLFRVNRSAAGPTRAGAPFYIGVRLQAPGFVRLVALSIQGAPESVPLNMAGELTIHVPADQIFSFGGYAVRATGGSLIEPSITHFVVIASREPIADGEFDRELLTIAKRTALTDPGRLAEELARELARRFAAEARLIAVPGR
jgi:hypothetical protein